MCRILCVHFKSSEKQEAFQRQVVNYSKLSSLVNATSEGVLYKGKCTGLGNGFYTQ